MPPVRKRQKRILLALGWYDYRLHEGIAKYAVEKGWHLCPDTNSIGTNFHGSLCSGASSAPRN